jgi:hypothetical protein
MEKGVTTNPDDALSGLIFMAWLGVIVISGGLAVDGVISGAWIQVIGGVALLAFLSRMIWQAGRVVRKALKGEKP